MSHIERLFTKPKFAPKEVIISTVLNGFIVRVIEIKDIDNPAQTTARAYVCQSKKELFELLQAIFELTEFEKG